MKQVVCSIGIIVISVGLNLTRLVCGGDVLLMMSCDVCVARVIHWIIDNSADANVQSL